MILKQAYNYYKICLSDRQLNKMMKKKIQIGIEDSGSIVKELSKKAGKSDVDSKKSSPAGKIFMRNEIENEEEEKDIVQIEGKEHGTDLSYKLVEKYDLMKKIEEGVPIDKYIQEYVKRDIAAEFQVVSSFNMSSC